MVEHRGQASLLAPRPSLKRGTGDTTETVHDIVGWLSGSDSYELDEAGLVAALGGRLRAAGLPLDRLTLHIRMPHPEFCGRTVAWAPGESVEVYERAHGSLESVDFAGSPLRVVMETCRPLHVRLDTEEGRKWTHIDVYQGRGLVEHFIVSLGNREGPSAATFCTADPKGFSAADCDVMRAIVPALRGACEIRILRQVERMLLNTYIGSSTARRLLAGEVRRGHVETIEVALMLCDLRGFTELSNRLPSQRIMQVLDVYFDYVVPAITEAGGEVLKFMGDGVLAYFRGDHARNAAASALRAAVTSIDNLACIDLPDAKLVAGVALHYGEVSYGNIGAIHRLDFTIIGRDVNLVSRIQGVCAAVNQPILLSKKFASLLHGVQTESIGYHDLKGFDEPVELYALQRQFHCMRERREPGLLTASH